MQTKGSVDKKYINAYKIIFIKISYRKIQHLFTQIYLHKDFFFAWTYVKGHTNQHLIATAVEYGKPMWNKSGLASPFKKTAVVQTVISVCERLWEQKLNTLLKRNALKNKRLTHKSLTKLVGVKTNVTCREIKLCPACSIKCVQHVATSDQVWVVSKVQ